MDQYDIQRMKTFHRWMRMDDVDCDFLPILDREERGGPFCSAALIALAGGLPELALHFHPANPKLLLANHAVACHTLYHTTHMHIYIIKSCFNI